MCHNFKSAGSSKNLQIYSNNLQKCEESQQIDITIMYNCSLQYKPPLTRSREIDICTLYSQAFNQGLIFLGEPHGTLLLDVHFFQSLQCKLKITWSASVQMPIYFFWLSDVLVKLYKNMKRSTASLIGFPYILQYFDAYMCKIQLCQTT